ncbi:MAG TPA: hypothetical protein PL000_23095, partial [Anaerolineales bacterium]|nr:hypothetical protein [Anaerolineales bacterium]
KGDSSGPNPPAFLTRNRWTKCSVQIVLSNFGCGFLSHASAIFSPDALHQTQKSPRLIQKSTTQNSTNYLYRTLSFYKKPYQLKKYLFLPLCPHRNESTHERKRI